MKGLITVQLTCGLSLLHMSLVAAVYLPFYDDKFLGTDKRKAVQRQNLFFDMFIIFAILVRSYKDSRLLQDTQGSIRAHLFWHRECHKTAARLPCNIYIQSNPLMNLKIFATVHSLMNYTNLIDSCQAHLPVHYSSNIEFIRQK